MAARGAGAGGKGGAAVNKMETWLGRLWQGLLALILLTALLRIESALRSLDVSVTRLHSHLLLQKAAPAESPLPLLLPEGEKP